MSAAGQPPVPPPAPRRASATAARESPVPPIADEATQRAAALREQAVDVLARTLWGEARGETVRGIEAVAAVVVNRVRAARAPGGPRWWGVDIVSVCRAPFQFSCWNKNDPNRAKLLAVTEADPVFAICRRIAARAVSGALPDPTGGATHYHARSILPRWAEGKPACAEIGRHLFYRDIG